MSNIIDYFTEGAKETYDETVSFWSGDDKLDQTINAVKFTYDNPQLMKDTFSDNVDNSVKEFNDAVDEDINTTTNKLVQVGLILVASYTAFIYLTAKVKAKGGK